MINKFNNKTITSFIAVFVALVLLLTGTFAWVNFRQNMRNEFGGGPEEFPGGTTHDDFDEPNKDVYIENWGNRNLYVRIRLDEYMEIGEGAGEKGYLDGDERFPNPDNKAKSLINTANIDDMRTWTPHVPHDGQVQICDTSATFHDYWEWEMGGWKYYMPVPEEKRTDPAYVDQNTKEYDGTEDGVEKTLDAVVVTMDYWINNMNKKIGPYWVIDEDGWAYWAAPLEPGEATGLLLDSVTRTFDPDESYYYAINVIVQMATKFGEQNYEDFYDGSDDDRTATDNGKDLLGIISKDEQQGKPNVIPATDVKINGGDRTITVGGTYTPGCVVNPEGSTDKPVWTSSDDSIAKVDEDGEITGIAAGTAVIAVTAGSKTDTITVSVEPAGNDRDPYDSYKPVGDPPNIYEKLDENGDSKYPPEYIYNSDGTPGTAKDKSVCFNNGVYWAEDFEDGNIWKEVDGDGNLKKDSAIWGGPEGKPCGGAKAFKFGNDYWISLGQNIWQKVIKSEPTTLGPMTGGGPSENPAAGEVTPIREINGKYYVGPVGSDKIGEYYYGDSLEPDIGNGKVMSMADKKDDSDDKFYLSNGQMFTKDPKEIVEVIISPKNINMTKGGKQIFTAEVLRRDGTVVPPESSEGKVIWGVMDPKHPESYVDMQTGQMTVSPDEEHSTLSIMATCQTKMSVNDFALVTIDSTDDVQ